MKCHDAEVECEEYTVLRSSNAKGVVEA